MEILLWGLAGLLVIGGLLGSVLPVVPGVPIVFAGLFLFAWIDGFQTVGVWVLLILGVMTLASIFLDFAATALATRRYGAGRAAVLGAIFGLLVGLFFGLPGAVLGPLVGAFCGHLLARGTLEESSRAGIGAWLGVLLGALAKLLVSLLMIGIFALAWFG